MNSERARTEQPARSEVMRSQPFPFAFLLTITLVIICVLLVFYEGLRRGMDHVTMFGPENEQAAIAIALSDVVIT
jgi:ABC-type sulfate transport system permease subunit